MGMPRCRQQCDRRAIGMTHEVDRARPDGVDDLHQGRNLGLHEPRLEPSARLGPPVAPAVVDDGAHSVIGSEPAGNLLPGLDGAEAVVEEHGSAVGAGFAQGNESKPVAKERTLLDERQRVLEKNTSDCSRNGAIGIGSGMPGDGSSPKMMSGGGGTAVGDGNSGNTHSMWKAFGPAAIPV